MDRRALDSWVPIVQGIINIVAGLWSIVLRGNYVEVHQLNGTTFWMLTAHGMWLVLIGLVLLIGGYRRQKRFEFRLLAFGNAAGLLLTDMASAVAATIAPIYYTDMVLEAIFIVLWAFIWLRERQQGAQA